jgi:hypothetical protein
MKISQIDSVFRLPTPIGEGGPYRLAYRNLGTGASEDAPHGPPMTRVQPRKVPEIDPDTFQNSVTPIPHRSVERLSNVRELP